MIRKLIGILALLTASAFAQYATVSAKLTDGTGTVLKTAFVHLELNNCGRNLPTVPGAVTVKTAFDLKPSQLDGTILSNVLANDAIQCGNVASTYYVLTAMKDQNTSISPSGGIRYFVCSAAAPNGTACSNPIKGTFNLATATPMTGPPVQPGFSLLYQNPTNSEIWKQPAGTIGSFFGAFDFTNATVTGLPSSGLSSAVANTVVANVTGSTAVPAAVNIPTGVQLYTPGSGYSAETAAQAATLIQSVPLIIGASGTSSLLWNGPDAFCLFNSLGLDQLCDQTDPASGNSALAWNPNGLVNQRVFTTTFQTTPYTAGQVAAFDPSAGNFRVGAPAQICSSNNISVIGGNCASNWGGGDVGAQINAAYAAGPSNGAAIRVMPGIYSYTTPIVINTQGKPILLECPSGVTNSTSGNVPSVTQLNYTPTTGTAMQISTGTGSKVVGCSLSGSGSGNSTIGLLTGGTTSGASFIYSTIEKMDIGGFGVGLQTGYNAYISSYRDMTIHDNGTNFYAPSAATGTGENLSFFGGAIDNKGSSFSTTCINITSQGDYHVFGMSIDQCGMTINGVNIFLDLQPAHVENPNGVTALPFFTFGTACNYCTLNLWGGIWQEDGVGSGRTEFIKDTSSVSNHAVKVNVFSGTFVPQETVAQLVNFAGANCCATGAAFNWQNGGGGSTFTNTFSSGGSNGIYDFDVTNAYSIEWGASDGKSGVLSNTNTAKRTYTFPDVSGGVLVGTATSFTTTAATTDNVTVAGMTSSGHCYLQPTNSGAAGGIASAFVSAKTTNQITVTHTATSGWTFDVMCTPN